MTPTKALVSLIAGTALLVGGAAVGGEIVKAQQINALPTYLKLETTKDKIIGSKEKVDIVEYLYTTNEIVDGAEIPIIEAISKKGIEKELPEKRTENSRTYKADDGTYVIEFTGRQFLRNAEGKWLQVERATTTKDAYLLQTDSISFLPKAIAQSPETYYPSDDASMYKTINNGSWSDVHDGTSADIVAPGTDDYFAFLQRGGSGNYIALQRNFFTINTSSIPDTMTVTSATFSLYAKSYRQTVGGSINIVGATHADTITSSDYDQFTTTLYSSEISAASWGTSQYNNFTFNASGLAGISKTGNTKLAAMEATYDIANSPPAGTGDLNLYFAFSGVDTSGTTQDPKLVVSYSDAPVANYANPYNTILFE